MSVSEPPTDTETAGKDLSSDEECEQQEQSPEVAEPLKEESRQDGVTLSRADLDAIFSRIGSLEETCLVLRAKVGQLEGELEEQKRESATLSDENSRNRETIEKIVTILRGMTTVAALQMGEDPDEVVLDAAAGDSHISQDPNAEEYQPNGVTIPSPFVSLRRSGIYSGSRVNPGSAYYY